MENTGELPWNIFFSLIQVNPLEELKRNPFKDTVFSFMVLAMKLIVLKIVKKVLFHAWLSV